MTPSATPHAAPTTHVHTGRTLPAWTLHIALAVMTLGAVTAATGGTTLGGRNLALLLSTVLVALGYAAWRPTIAPVVGALAATGLGYLTLTPIDEPWRVPVIILCVHALVRLSWFTTSSRPAGRIEVEVLRRQWRPFVAIDLVGQAVGILALIMTRLEADGMLVRSQVLGIIGAVGLLGLSVLLLLPRSRTA